MEKILLGIDIGTSSCKLALISENGRVVDVAKSDYELFSYEGGRFEQNAEDYWGGTLLPRMLGVLRSHPTWRKDVQARPGLTTFPLSRP